MKRRTPSGLPHNQASETDYSRMANLLHRFFPDKAGARERAQLQDRLTALFQNASDGILLLDQSGLVLDANNAFCRLFVIEHDACTGKPVMEIMPPDLPTEISGRLRDACARLREGPPGGVFEFPFRGRLIQMIGPLSRDDTRCTVLYFRDVSVLRKGGVDALASEKHYRELIDATPDFIYSYDRENRFTSANKSLCTALRKPIEEIIGKTARELRLFPADSLNEWENLHRRIFESGSRIKTEQTARLPDGSVRIFEVILDPICGDSGAITGGRGMARDITERSNYEMQFANTQKLEALGMLAGGIAHDFNNMLGGIFGYMSLARKSLTDGNTAKALENIDKALIAYQPASDLTKRLLTFSKGGAPDKQVTGVADLLAETTKFVLSGSNVVPEFSFAQDLWKCEIDTTQINQAMTNILINAQQAMSAGGTVFISAANETIAPPGGAVRPGSYVRITIRDQGSGIPAENLPKIFDPFFTTKQNARGLGLATAYSIIRRHGGHIGVESLPGNGAALTIYLPAARQTQDAQTVNSDPYAGHGRILVMDDDMYIKDVARALLESMGYSVSVAGHGKEALELFDKAIAEKQPYDAVILDLTIPGGMGGKETIRELRKRDPKIKAIASSGYSEAPVMSHPDMYGFKAVLRKPYKRDDLGNALQQLLR
jgi:PAS domain S-box-containing protein